jgi:hypothetical protein
MDKAKLNIQNIVTAYKNMFPEEFAAFHTHMKTKRGLLHNDFAAAEGSEVIERSLFEVPETLHVMFLTKLPAEDDKWFQTLEGGRWFATHFREFASGIKV